MIARLLAIALLLTVAQPAHAAGDKRGAAVHFQRGRALFEAGSYVLALEEFDAGYATYPLPGFLVNIGQCQRKLEHLDDAVVAFQKFLDSNSGDARLRAEVQDALDEIAGERARRQAAADEERRRAELAAHPPLAARADLTAPAVATVDLSAPVAPVAVAAKPKRHRWVWAVVGVLAAGAVASAATVAYFETRPQTPQAGTLGLLDGRH